jgi:sugar/nucleoside kinase (ribokinase family)
MAARCIIVGDVMMDVTAMIDSDIAYASDTPARVTLQPGGVAANTAAWMATDGKAVTIVGCVGEDAFGRSIRDDLAALGVDVRLQSSAAHATGTCVVIVDRRRERTMFPDAGANAALVMEPLRDVITADCHVHLSGYTLMNPATTAVGLAVLELAVAAGASRSLDPASAAPLRAHLPLFRELLPTFDLVLANEDEAAVLSGREDPHEALEELSDIVPTVVVKVGARGALARNTTGTVTQRAPRHDVIDTTGAGDAFTAGFLPAWLAGSPLATAVSEGQRLASAAVERVGASPMVR